MFFSKGLLSLWILLFVFLFTWKFYFKICDSRFRRSNAGYEEFETPREGSKDNKGFEDEREYSRQASFESLPEPERPPLRHIDTYCKPECPCLSKRYTIATLACIGRISKQISLSFSSFTICLWTMNFSPVLNNKIWVRLYLITYIFLIEND